MELESRGMIICILNVITAIWVVFCAQTIAYIQDKARPNLGKGAQDVYFICYCMMCLDWFVICTLCIWQVVKRKKNKNANENGDNIKDSIDI